MDAILALQDGKVFEGEAIGSGEIIGKLILNTAVVGYQEMLTDPANAGKILVLTYPLIGNYGIAPKFNESKNVWAAGLVIKEKSRIYSNWQAKMSLEDFLKKNNLLAITGIDTRSLAVHLRQKGEMQGIISTKSKDVKELLVKIKNFSAHPQMSVLEKISVKKITPAGKNNGKTKIAVLDLGLTNSILRQLELMNLNLSIFPYDTSAEVIKKHKPKGLIISGGPEEDVKLREVACNIARLIGKMPILGISTGFQVMAQALGARLTRLKLGHRGVNFPLHNPLSYKGAITAQNHSLVVDAESLSGIKEIKITGFNLNDRTVEEVESKKLKLLGVQYNLASPGFDEVHPAFKRFLKMVSKN